MSSLSIVFEFAGNQVDAYTSATNSGNSASIIAISSTPFQKAGFVQITITDASFENDSEFLACAKQTSRASRSSAPV